MASRTVLRSVCLADPWRPFHRTASKKSVSCLSTPSMRLYGVGGSSLKLEINLRCGCEVARVRSFRRRGFRMNCCSSHNHENFSLAYSSSVGDGDEDEQGPPQEAVLKAMSDISKTEGRVEQTTNVVIGGTVTNDSTNEWLALDQKVNCYPTVRGFTAIGTGGDDFVQSMVVAVESVIQQPIPEGCIRQKLSSRVNMYLSTLDQFESFPVNRCKLYTMP